MLFEVILEITIARLDFADGLLDLALFLYPLVAHNLAGDFLSFTFRFFDSAFDLIFVHDYLPTMNCDNGPCVFKLPGVQ